MADNVDRVFQIDKDRRFGAIAPSLPSGFDVNESPMGILNPKNRVPEAFGEVRCVLKGLGTVSKLGFSCNP